MKRLIWALLVFVGGYFIAGCSYPSFKRTLKDTLVEPVYEARAVKVEKVAIFPFADYSFQQDFVRPLRWGLNKKITEELADEFIKQGIQVAVQEDVEGLLISEGIIKPVDTKRLIENLQDIEDKLEEELYISIISPEYELKREHSKEMRKEIEEMIKDRRQNQPILAYIFKLLSLYPQEPLTEGVSTGLSREKIKELGEKLGVDVIVRGRIIEAGELQKTNPGLTSGGIIGFLLNPLITLTVGKRDSPFFIGYAQKERYEKDLLEAHSSQYLYDQPTGKRLSVVQIRVYLQDVKTGEVFWSGRREVRTSPDLFQEYHKDLFDRSIRRAVSSLMKDLFTKPLRGNRGYIYYKK